MSKILSYSDNINGVDWVAREPYTDDDIRKIDDPNGTLVEYPRTAIPSPFAQVDLVATAYSQLAADKDLAGPGMYRRLVSNALDVAQLLFAFPDYASEVRVIRWNPRSSIEHLLSQPSHRLIGETLRLFMQTDSGSCNFNPDDNWYILTCNNKVLGSTSPATFTMGAPDPAPMSEIKLEEGVTLFDATTRHLWERDADFIEYFVHLYNAHPQLRLKQKCVYDYVLANLEILRVRRPEIYTRITARVANPHALPSEQAARMLTESLPKYYDEFRDGINPTVLGVPLYVRKRTDVLQCISESDFLLRPQLKPDNTEETDIRLPLVLTPGFSAPGGERFRYLKNYWIDTTEVNTGGLAPDERTLPGTSIMYPWLTAEDFLEPDIIELATPMDCQHFFSGVHGRYEDQNGWILPVKPEFFKYFTARALQENVAPGVPCLEIKERGDAVAVMLRIPTRRSYVELSRTYLRGVAPVENREADRCGRVIEQARVSVGIFPFVRTGHGDNYNIQLFVMLPDHTVDLTFCADSIRLDGVREPYVRTHTRVARTAYYDVDRSFSHIQVSLNSTDGRRQTCGVIVPRWPQYHPSVESFTFAVDFGTTNTHIEWARDNMPPAPLSFEASSDSTLLATLAKAGSLAQADTYTEIEFLPRNIGGLYGFPLRSALASNTGSEARWPEVLRSINIPFLYERKAFNGYDVTTGLKWAGDTTMAEQFLRELVLLVRARVLLCGGNPQNIKLIYFYPVSMKRSMRARLAGLWESLCSRYLSADSRMLHSYPESIAPTFHYNNAGRDGVSFVSVDIGGGTSDVVVYKADNQRYMSEPDLLTSFRFAGNAIFGDGFTSADADNNPLVREYAAYFSDMFATDPYLSYLNVILGDIIEGKRSEDVNAFLFSIEQAEVLSHLSPVDRSRYSYNTLLGADTRLKIVFVYFYSAIAYYIARLMKDSGLELPRHICFSGTGSKILQIVGRPESIQLLTNSIFGWIYGCESNVLVQYERSIPKQITCKGGINLLRQTENGDLDPLLFAEHRVMGRKQAYTLTDAPHFTYGSIRTLEQRRSIAAAVREYNNFFISLLADSSTGIRDEFGIEADAMTVFRELADRDVETYLTAGIKAFLPAAREDDEIVEDVPFFYPIIGIIRNTLLPALLSKNTKPI